MLESSSWIPKFVRTVRNPITEPTVRICIETFRESIYPRNVGAPSDIATLAKAVRVLESKVGSSLNAVLPTSEVPPASAQQAATVTNFRPTL
jgi:hypothetical protein